MASSSSLMDEVFALLSLADQLEKQQSHIEAATKYYEAVYLMKRCLDLLPQTVNEESTRQLIQEKVAHYERVAAKLMQEETSTVLHCDHNTQSNNIYNYPVPSPIENFYYLESNVLTAAPTATSGTGVHQSSPQSAQSMHPLNVLVRQATQKLSQALDWDEAGNSTRAKDTYMSAAELFLQGLKLAQQEQHQELQSLIRRRLESTIERIEQLKLGNGGKQKGSLKGSASDKKANFNSSMSATGLLKR